LRSTLPEVGRSWPVSTLNRVVLPAPLGPITACRAPHSIRRSTFWRASKAPKDFESDSASRIDLLCGATASAADIGDHSFSVTGDVRRSVGCGLRSAAGEPG